MRPAFTPLGRLDTCGPSIARLTAYARQRSLIPVPTCHRHQSRFAALASRNPAYGNLGPVSLTDVTGGETLGNFTMAKKIQIMEVEFTDCPLVIADFKVFDLWGLAQRPALLIGMNYLVQFSKVSIDYGLKELRFDRASLSAPLPA